MKKTIILVAVVLVILMAVITVLLDKKEKSVDLTLETAIQIAQDSECADYGEIANTGDYNELWGIWYVDIDVADDDGRFVYDCEVNMYTGTAKFIVDKAFNWYESDVVEPESDQEEVDEDILSIKRAMRIAESSECAEYGSMKDTGYLNYETETWWLNMHDSEDEWGEEIYYVCEVDMINEVGKIHQRDVIDMTQLMD